MDTEKLIAEYSEQYCLGLEAAYGKGMMSEGGVDAIETMFTDIDLKNKTALDIGFGLGGVPFYLAEKYNTNVKGVEINPWMVTETLQRTPTAIKPLVDFLVYDPKAALPFPDNHFDIVYGKGVLVHLENKSQLFQEAHRLLKPHGKIVIVDWLSTSIGTWGTKIQKMCELENLSLFAETETSYQTLLNQAGFTNMQMSNQSADYAKYNRQVVANLQASVSAKIFRERFGEHVWQASVAGYELIAEAIEQNELLIRCFHCSKKY